MHPKKYALLLLAKLLIFSFRLLAMDGPPQVPIECFQHIAINLNIPQLVTLKKLSRSSNIALSDEKFLYKITPKFHPFSFPIFNKLSDPWQTLNCIYSFNRANSVLPISCSMKYKNKFEKIIDRRASQSRYLALSESGKVNSYMKNDLSLFLSSAVVLDSIIDLNGEKIISIRNYWDRSLALSDQGKVYWLTNYGKPELVEKLKDKIMVAISNDRNKALALTLQGEVYAFIATNPDIVLIEDRLKTKKIIAIAAESGAYLALSNKGKLYGWGDNSSGALGFKKHKIIKEPKKYKKRKFGNARIIAIASCRNYFLALTNTGKVFIWGNYFDTRLYPPLRPTVVQGKLEKKHVISIWTDGFFHAAKSKDGEIFCWEMNEIGNANFIDEKNPWAIINSDTVVD